MSMRMLPPATQSIHYHHGHLMLAPAVRLSAVRLHLTKAAGNVTLQPCAAHSSVVCSPLLQAMKPYAMQPCANPQQRSVFATAAGNDALQPCAVAAHGLLAIAAGNVTLQPCAAHSRAV